MEFALLLPFLGAMLVGGIDISRIYNDTITLANAAAAGAQYGAMSPSTSTDFDKMEQIALTDSGGSSTVTADADRFCECPDGNSVGCNGNCSGGVQPFIYVRVRVAKAFHPLINYPGIADDVTLTREAVMRAR